MKESLIGLLDCNNFFVSCERLFRPDLVGKPVIVLSSNDGCVVARSKEVKDIGVPMGVPYFHIKDIVKKEGITTFSSHFALYRDISRRVFSVMKNDLGTLEQYSVDEAFFNLTGNPEEQALRLKQAVETQVGIPVSVGIAQTKTLAKFANTIAKKTTGVKVLFGPEWGSLAATANLSEIWGVGGNLELKYKRSGIVTAGDLLATDPAVVAQLFGVQGVRLQQELQGNQVFRLHAKREPQKSIMSSRSFKHTTTQLAVLEDAVAYHVRHAVADLRAMKHEALEIRIAVLPSRHGDFMLQGGSKTSVLTAASADTITLLREAEKLLAELFVAGVPYKKVGVTLSVLQPQAQAQAGLFAAYQETNRDSLMAALDSINAKAGRELLQVGSRLLVNKWQSKQDDKSPAYTTRWSQIATVKT